MTGDPEGIVDAPELPDVRNDTVPEPLQPGDEQEAENGAPPPIPDPPDTDPIPEEEPEE